VCKVVSRDSSRVPDVEELSLPENHENHPPLAPSLGDASAVAVAICSGFGSGSGIVDGPGISIMGTGAGGGAVTLVSRIPTPSIMPNKIPPNAADFMADLSPVRSWRSPPVSAADAMLFHGSSFFLIATMVQSNVEKRPPHTAKLPPILGASRRMDCTRASLVSIIHIIMYTTMMYYW